MESVLIETEPRVGQAGQGCRERQPLREGENPGALDWEAACPVMLPCATTESSIAIVEAELVHLYREVDQHALMYGLVGAM